MDLFPDKILVTKENSRFVPHTPCWFWIGVKNAGGYGRVFYQGSFWFTHRLSVILSGRNFKLKPFGCHTCDHPPCCNPEHIFVGTHAENMFDRIKWSATLPDEEIEEIKRSTLPDEVLARRHKIARNQVTCIRSPRGYSPQRFDFKRVGIVT